MSKAWGGIGAWAAEAEREEEEERKAAAAAVPPPESKGFPSLREAASAKPKKTKMTLSEFTMGTYSSSGGGVVGGGGARLTDYNRLTHEEMMLLPTRPKERSTEEMQHGRLGGGFSSYGRSGPPARRVNNEQSDGSWGSGRGQYGGFDERRGPPSRVSDYDQLSRADEVDDWAMTKKTIPPFDSGRQNRYGGLGTGGSGGISRANEVDNWTAGKRSIPVRSSTFGSGFRDSGPEPDRWTGGGGRGGFSEERHRLVLDPLRGEMNEPVVKTNKPNPFGAARPREEVLAEKGLDWKKLDSEIEAKKVASRPTSSHSSRPSSAQSSRSEGPQQQGVSNLVRPRPKVNPFGVAKPREVLLEERGQDWRKIDLDIERRRMDRQETEEEKILKEEIDHLKKEIEKVPMPNSEFAGRSQSTLRDTLHNKERELEILIQDLENKVRVGQKVVERPSSGAGRIDSFPDRPPSQSGSSDGSRGVEFADRPRSRGIANSWMRPGDDRRGFQGGRDGGFRGGFQGGKDGGFRGGFQGGRDRGFLGNRDLNGSRSRDRW